MEEATNSFSYFETCRNCSICRRELFRDSNPQLLPCLHTCCGQCLDDVKAFEVESKSVTNDQTPQSTSNQNSDKDNYPRCEECNHFFKSDQCMDNIFLLNYFLREKKGIRPSETDATGDESKDDAVDWVSLTSCGGCETSGDLVAYCKQCEGGLCTDCLATHRTMKIFRTHEPKERENNEEEKVVEQFVKRYSTCKIHEKEHYSLYCLPCDEVTCKDCLISNHKDHRWEKITEMKNKFVDEITSSMVNISEKRELVQNSLKVLEQRQNQLNTQQQNVRNDILQCANKLKAAVEELSQSLFEDLTKRCELKKSEYAKSQANLKSTEESLRFVEAFLSEIVDKSFPVDKGFAVALLFTKKLIQSQIANLLQKQCFNPNSNEDFELKLESNLVRFSLENMIKDAWHISSSKQSNSPSISCENNGPNSATSSCERIAHKRNSSELEIIDSIPAKRPSQSAATNPLAACKQCVDNVQYSECATSSSLSYAASVSQNVPNNYSLHSPLIMNAQQSTAYPVMYSGHANTQQHYVNQVPSSGHTSNRSIYPPNVVVAHPPRYHGIHSTVPNQPILPRTTPAQQSATLQPNVFIANGVSAIFENFPGATFAATQIGYHQQQQQIQTQHQSSLNQRRDTRLIAGRLGTGSQMAHQQFHLQPTVALVQSKSTPTVTVVQQLTTPVQPKSVLSDAMSQPQPQPQPRPPAPPPSQPKQQTIQPQAQRSQISQSTVSKILEQKKLLQQQNINLVTLLPPPESMETSVLQRRLSDNGPINKDSVLSQQSNVEAKNEDRECQLYPPTVAGQQSKGTSTCGLFQTQPSNNLNSARISTVRRSADIPVTSESNKSLIRSEKTYSRIQSPPSPIAKKLPTVTSPEKVSSTVNIQSDTENGKVTSSTNAANDVSKTKASKRKETELTTEVVSTTENGYNITFTRESPVHANNGLSSDTEIMQEPIDDEEENADNDEWCSVCKDGGELLCCDSCPRAFHMHCHVPSLKTIPQAAWTCQLCTDKKRVQNGIRNGNQVGPHAAHVNEMACQRILLELFCHKDSSVISGSEINLSTIKQNLECKANYTESEFIREINEVFRHFYFHNKSKPINYECGINLEKHFKKLVETFLVDYKSMVKAKLWELGSNCRPKKGRL